MLQDRIGIEIVFVELTTEFQIDEVDLLAKLTPNTRVVSFSGASNVTGSVFNWHRISELVRSIRGDQTYLVMDGSQAVPHVSLDVRSLDLDFCIFTGHKLYADSGIGILYGKKSHLKSLTPSIGGGGAINFVHEDGYEIAGLPFRFEPGTPNMTGAVSLLRSLEYIESIGGMVSIQEHESLLVEYFLTQWKSLSKSFRLIGSMDRKDRIGVFSFTHDTLHANDLADLLAEKNICVRAGHHCTEPFHRRLGLSGSIRVSIGISTTLGDLDRLFSVLKQI